jgi:hypothetical protein
MELHMVLFFKTIDLELTIFIYLFGSILHPLGYKHEENFFELKGNHGT